MIYRRIDDLFLDPEVFNPDSMLGVPGLMRAWKAGRVAIANAPGAGVADDKVVYAWVPDIIRYYLDEEPLIANVPTYRCLYEDERKFVLDNLRELVLKPANESGGYGIVIGNRATDSQLAAAAEAVDDDPRNWVAQPILQLSTAPTVCDDVVEPRHVDLRPFILTGETSYVTAGGLTRVALAQGLADRQLVPGRRHQGHLDRRPRRRLGDVLMAVMLLFAGRGADLLGGALSRARRGHGPHRAGPQRDARRPAESECRDVATADLVVGSGAQYDARFGEEVSENGDRLVPALRPRERGQRRQLRRRRRENLRTTRETIPRDGWQALNDPISTSTSRSTAASTGEHASASSDASSPTAGASTGSSPRR